MRILVIVSGEYGVRHVTYPPALPKWEGGWLCDEFGDFLKQCFV